MSENATSQILGPGQPPAEVKGPSFDTMGWLHTTSPDVSYEDRRANGNPLQETAPMTPKAWDNDSIKRPDLMERTANEINGGRTLSDGGGVG